MSNIAYEVGQRIRKYRQKANMTQEKLAELAELHHTYIGQVERGEKNLTLTTLERIAQALHVSYSELFGETMGKHDKNSISLQCYDLIDCLSLSNQEHIYNILSELVQINK